MILPIFWRRLANIAGTIRTQIMVEIERNPLAVRQGAAAIACIAAAAVAMPVISHRAAEQREGAEWAARSQAFQIELAQLRTDGSESAAEPDARVELTAFRVEDGLRARGRANMFAHMNKAHAKLVPAALRGPMAPSADTGTATQARVNPREQRCMSEAIYYEARGEAYDGQVAVAEVIMNRVRSKHYPGSVCGVVYQGSHRATGCQFTFTCDGSLNRRPRGRGWERAQHVATLVMQGYTRPVTQRATHYHTREINPIWSSGLVQTANIGSHVFYRFPSRAEAPAYQQALARRRGAIARRASPAELIPAASEAGRSAEEQEAVRIEGALTSPEEGVEAEVVATEAAATNAHQAPVTPAPVAASAGAADGDVAT
jgi:spore germination cell wall hydrolase CwlJ-like protein